MIRMVYFGSSEFSVQVLATLEKRGILPVLIVSTPDKPKGRKLVLSPTPVKVWAQERNIPVITPSKFDAEIIATLLQYPADVYVVASYGKIIPVTILNIPPRHTLNIHPSLLPKYRGASPIQSAVLADDKKTGVTIMRLDSEMDHGPILGQVPVTFDIWPQLYEIKKILAEKGGDLLATILPNWIAGTHPETPQDHSLATFTKKIEKEDGLVDIVHDDPYLIFRKIQAYTPWPSVYFFTEKKGLKIRVKIVKASFNEGRLTLERVIPEGKPEMSYQDFLHSL